MDENLFESRHLIGQSKPRNQAGGDIAGGSQFYHVYKPGQYDHIERQMLAHGLVSLQAPSLVNWEEQIYRSAQKLDLPFPVLVSVHDTTTRTKFVGPNVQMLLERSDLPGGALNELEIASLIVNVLLANAPLADEGFMPFDGHLQNHWCTLEKGLQGGHLEFRQILAGDHTYTWRKGMVFGRPLWCSSNMLHFPPEAKWYTHQDEAAFARILNKQGLEGSTLGNIVKNLAYIKDPHHLREQRHKLEAAYAQHQSPQKLQEALDNGDIEPHRMIQYAIATHLLSFGEKRNMPEATRQAIAKCHTHLKRMSDVRPECRFTTLLEAADAVKACWDTSLPERSLNPWPAKVPRYFVCDVRGATDPDPSPSGGLENTFSMDGDSALMSGTESNANISGWGWLKDRPLIPIFALVLGISLTVGNRPPQTPDEFKRQAEQLKLAQVIRKASSNNPATANTAMRDLKAVINNPMDQNRKFVISQLEDHFVQFKQRYLGKPIFQGGALKLNGSATSQQRVENELQRFADLGVEEAKKWLEVYRQVNSG